MCVMQGKKKCRLIQFYDKKTKNKKTKIKQCIVAQCVEWKAPGLKKEGGEWETQSHKEEEEKKEEETELRQRITACMLSSVWDYTAVGDLLVASCDESEMCRWQRVHTWATDAKVFKSPICYIWNNVTLPQPYQFPMRIWIKRFAKKKGSSPISPKPTPTVFPSQC